MLACLATVGCGSAPDRSGPYDGGPDAADIPAARAEWNKWRRYAQEHCRLDTARFGGDFDHPSEPSSVFLDRLLLMTDFRDEGYMRVVILTEEWHRDAVRPWAGRATPDIAREDEDDPFIGYSRVDICQQPEDEHADCMAGTMELRAERPRRPADLISVDMTLRSDLGRIEISNTLYPCTPYSEP